MTVMVLLFTFPIVFMIIAHEEHQSFKKQEETFIQIQETEKYWLSTHTD